MNGRVAEALRAHNSDDELAVVVIARNESRHIGMCLDALMRSLEGYPTARVLLVDSGSTDATVEIASHYAIHIYRYAGPPYTAAAGRRVGFERTNARYVLFVDGDCCVEPGWIELALARLRRDPSAGVIYGQRREIFEDTPEHAAVAAPPAAEYGMGGNALYRADAMREAGGFNPYLKAGEEAELLGRIVACGYRQLATPEVMFTHHTLAKSTVRGFMSRLRRGLSRGTGQTLRLALAQGLFFYHARRLNRYLITCAYLIAGVLAVVASTAVRSAAPFAAWLSCGVLGFTLLCYRRHSVRSAAFIIADWVSVAIHLPADFLRKPLHADGFDPDVEQLRHVNPQRHLNVQPWM